MSEAQTAALTLVRKPVTSADFKQNAEFYFAAANKATVVYNDALAAYQHSVKLESVGTGTDIVFNEGKGDTAQVLSGKVLARLEDGKYQVLIQFVGEKARLIEVKPSDIKAVRDEAVEVQVSEEPVEAPAVTPEFDAQ
jgi:hypothetical protein